MVEADLTAIENSDAVVVLPGAEDVPEVAHAAMRGVPLVTFDDLIAAELAA